MSRVLPSTCGMRESEPYRYQPTVRRSLPHSGLRSVGDIYEVIPQMLEALKSVASFP